MRPGPTRERRARIDGFEWSMPERLPKPLKPKPQSLFQRLCLYVPWAGIGVGFVLATFLLIASRILKERWQPSVEKFTPPFHYELGGKPDLPSAIQSSFEEQDPSRLAGGDRWAPGRSSHEEESIAKGSLAGGAGVGSHSESSSEDEEPPQTYRGQNGGWKEDSGDVDDKATESLHSSRAGDAELKRGGFYSRESKSGNGGQEVESEFASGGAVRENSGNMDPGLGASLSGTGSQEAESLRNPQSESESEERGVPMRTSQMGAGAQAQEIAREDGYSDSEIGLKQEQNPALYRADAGFPTDIKTKNPFEQRDVPKQVFNERGEADMDVASGTSGRQAGGSTDLDSSTRTGPLEEEEARKPVREAEGDETRSVSRRQGGRLTDPDSSTGTGALEEGEVRKPSWEESHTYESEEPRHTALGTRTASASHLDPRGSTFTFDGNREERDPRPGEGDSDGNGLHRDDNSRGFRGNQVRATQDEIAGENGDEGKPHRLGTQRGYRNGKQTGETFSREDVDAVAGQSQEEVRNEDSGPGSSHRTKGGMPEGGIEGEEEERRDEDDAASRNVDGVRDTTVDDRQSFQGQGQGQGRLRGGSGRGGEEVAAGTGYGSGIGGQGGDGYAAKQEALGGGHLRGSSWRSGGIASRLPDPARTGEEEAEAQMSTSGLAEHGTGPLREHRQTDLEPKRASEAVAAADEEESLDDIWKRLLDKPRNGARRRHEGGSWVEEGAQSLDEIWTKHFAENKGGKGLVDRGREGQGGAGKEQEEDRDLDIIWEKHFVKPKQGRSGEEEEDGDLARAINGDASQARTYSGETKTRTSSRVQGFDSSDDSEDLLTKGGRMHRDSSRFEGQESEMRRGGAGLVGRKAEGKFSDDGEGSHEGEALKSARTGDRQDAFMVASSGEESTARQSEPVKEFWGAQEGGGGDEVARNRQGVPENRGVQVDGQLDAKEDGFEAEEGSREGFRGSSPRDKGGEDGEAREVSRGEGRETEMGAGSGGEGDTRGEGGGSLSTSNSSWNGQSHGRDEEEARAVEGEGERLPGQEDRQT